MIKIDRDAHDKEHYHIYAQRAENGWFLTGTLYYVAVESMFPNVINQHNDAFPLFVNVNDYKISYDENSPGVKRLKEYAKLWKEVNNA